MCGLSRISWPAIILALSILIAPSVTMAKEIAVTLPPLAGLVRMLDDKAEILCLLPAGADPHHFQLQPRTLEKLANSKLLIRASFDDGGWPLPPSHKHVLDLWPDKDHGWVSPKEVRAVLPLIAGALIKLNPQQKNSIKANLRRAITTTHNIEAQWRQTLATVKTAGVIMQHPAWRRLMHDMQVPILNVLESGHHGHEHGPHALDQSLHDLAEHPGAWLISDAGHNNRALQWLQDHSEQSIHHVRLNALSDCTKRWDEMMAANLKQFQSAHR